MIKVFACLAIVLSAVTFTTKAQSSGAPRIYDVEFVKGAFEDSGHVQPNGPCPPTVPQGVCGNGNSKGYSLEGRAGDFITISLDSRNDGAVFSIFTPDGEILKNGSAREWWAGELPANGSYRINVYSRMNSTPFKVLFTRTR
jgi:hypothetical protein